MVNERASPLGYGAVSVMFLNTWVAVFMLLDDRIGLYCLRHHQNIWSVNE